MLRISDEKTYTCGQPGSARIVFRANPALPDDKQEITWMHVERVSYGLHKFARAFAQNGRKSFPSVDLVLTEEEDEEFGVDHADVALGWIGNPRDI